MGRGISMGMLRGLGGEDELFECRGIRLFLFTGGKFARKYVRRTKGVKGMSLIACSRVCRCLGSEKVATFWMCVSFLLGLVGIRSVEYAECW